ncbi:alanine racemase [Paenibacillus sp. IB182496]|uniref:Alanine racemase n=1 Tax=Paenibacillus sabuli TaxID=2772509 RepID=A0A927BXY4_9BACL|nr:alanine racemase [Paenibacillus sabuli]MBD2847790.1 alanine racemase [Paenibacillus sabuli]
MTSYYRPTRAEISLDALGGNIAAFRGAIPNDMRIMASVKANAYGHGAVEIARKAVKCGADALGVAFLDEALQLRRAGITAPILVLGYVGPEGLAVARDFDIAVTLFREDILEAAAQLPPGPHKLRVQLKIDTGMGRLGLLPDAPWQRFVERALALPGLEIEGMYTHYATADEADKSYARLQHERFASIAAEVRRRDYPIPLLHAGNSAAGIDTPEWAGGMLRLGIGMYGIYPSAEVNRQRIPLQPVLSLRSELVMAKQVPAGWGVSYGVRYKAQRAERIGTLPIGYADGYSRMLTGKAEVLVRGHRAPVVGTICMDQCMVALDGAAGGLGPVQAGEEVVLIGSQGEASITAEEVASHLGTIPYEVICMLAARVPRVYTEHGRIIAIGNALD